MMVLDWTQFLNSRRKKTSIPFINVITRLRYFISEEILYEIIHSVRGNIFILEETAAGSSVFMG